MGDMMTALADDPASACGIFCVETRDGYYLSDGYAALMESAFAAHHASRCCSPPTSAATDRTAWRSA